LTRIPRYALMTKKLRAAELSETVAWSMLMLCFAAAASVLSYLCVTVNAPLVDESLARLDRELGFDWESVYYWVRSHPWVHLILQLAYVSGHYQVVGIPFILGMMGRHEDLSELILLLMLSTILLLIVSTPFPARSAFIFYNVKDISLTETVSHFDLLRAGTLRVFDIEHTQGLISMPSFHTTVAIFLAYSLRRVAMLLPAGVLLNVTMILSTPTEGGHYFVDVAAGLLLAFVTIQIFKLASGPGKVTWLLQAGREAKRLSLEITSVARGTMDKGWRVDR
jgi:membrane-associated phospholipid phosphatase